MFAKLLSTSTILLLIATPVMADQQSYCAAYATDFANAQTKDKPLWQHKYEIALQSCLVVSNPVIAKSTPSEKSTKKPLPAEKKIAEMVPPEPTFTKLRMEAGTDEWNAYCAKKYTSFNVRTGMYLSHTGIDRKCVVSKP